MDLNIPEPSAYPLESVVLSEKRIAVYCVEVEMRPHNGYLLANTYREGFLKVLHHLGFHKRARGKSYFYIRDIGGIIEEVSKADIRDAFYTFLRRQGDLDFAFGEHPIHISIEPIIEIFRRQQNQLFVDSMLESLPTHTKPILRDSENVCYKPFLNGVLKIRMQGIEFIPYTDIKEAIWRGSIIQHNLIRERSTDCHFRKYLHNVAGRNIFSFSSAIGYLLHGYNSPSKGQAVILYDAEPSDKNNPQGGTGKGVFANAVREMTTVTKIDGKKFNPNSAFLWQQVIDETRVIWIDDLDTKVGFNTFHSMLTDGLTIEKKNQHEYTLPPGESPKLLLSSNTILQGEGTTNRRRQYVLEFSDHYSSQIKKGTEEPLRDEHGCYFFTDDWDETEWNAFYLYMCGCIHDYMMFGLIPPQQSNIEANKLIQATGKEFAEYITTQIAEGVEYKTVEKFEEFKGMYLGSDSDLKQRGFTNRLGKYCDIFDKELRLKPRDKTSYFTIIPKQETGI